MNEGSLSALFLDLFSGGREYAQTGAADEFELSQIEQKVSGAAGDCGRKLMFQIGCGKGVEAAAEFYGDRARVGNVF